MSTNKNIKDCNRTFYEIISKDSQLFTTIGGHLNKRGLSNQLRGRIFQNNF